mgnify:CR=1 FL=1
MGKGTGRRTWAFHRRTPGLTTGPSQGTLAFVKRTHELDHHAARILEEIALDEAITQRKLSERVGIALAVTNSYVGRLVRKGYLKARTLPRNRLKYFVTPSGLALKARLTYEYVTGSLRFYQEARTRLKTVLARIGETTQILVFTCRDDVARAGQAVGAPILNL